MKKIIIILMSLLFSLQASADDIDTILKDLNNNIGNHTNIEKYITRLINGNYNFNYPVFLDNRNDHRGKKDPNGFLLINYLLMYSWNMKEPPPDIVEQTLRVAGFTSKANLDRVVLYRGWGTFNALQAAAFSCNTTLMDKLYNSVSATWSSTNRVLNKKISALSAAYSGGCFDNFVHVLNKVTPYTDQCDFLKRPYDFKTNASGEIEQYLVDNYNITDYYSCVRRLKYKRASGDVSAPEKETLTSLSKMIDQNKSKELLAAVSDTVNRNGYTFPWNTLINGETIANKLVAVIGKKAIIDELGLNTLEITNKDFYGSLRLILNYNDTPYPLLKKGKSSYDTYSLLAENCYSFDGLVSLTQAQAKESRYTSGDSAKSLLNIYIENNCQEAMAFENNSVSVLDSGCSIFDSKNYDSDSALGRYFLNKYGFDDYDTCYESLQGGYSLMSKTKFLLK